MAVNTLDNLFNETLKDIYYAEKKLVKSLPQMAKKATSSELKQAIESHLEETKTHVERLEEVFASIGQKPTTKKCDALEGLLAEAEELMGEIKDPRTLDAAIISSAQSVEHYEIARYGTLACWAKELGYDDAKSLLGSTLDEEKAADEKLSSVAEGSVNAQAA